MVRILLSYNADPRKRDSHQRTALHFASYAESDKCSGEHAFPEDRACATVKLLLDSAPDMIDQRDEDGATPLLFAAKTIRTTFSILNLLHQRGADITAADNNHENALHLAASDSHDYPSLGVHDIHESIRYLVQNGVGLEGKQKLGATPLILALTRGEQSSDVVDALLRNGADVRAALEGGMTALHCAYSKGYQDGIGKVLLSYGADLGAKDEKGRVPADCIPKREAAFRRGRGRGVFTASV
ncbi:ankyrin [Cadophora sp. DSE1049]|nr:ankyrin [Cadophora sp. DSE1049]